MPRPTRRTIALVTTAFLGGALVTGLAYPALDFIQTCKDALAGGSGAPTAQAPKLPDFPGARATPAAGVSLGSPDAKVVVWEFSDFECPFCRLFSDQVLPLLKKDYVDTGKVRFVFFDFPLPMHKRAPLVHEAARCVLEQDQKKFWAYHDLLFQRQKVWISDVKPEGLLTTWAEEVGADRTRFATCLESGQTRKPILENYSFGQEWRVEGTPWIYVNGVHVPNGDPLRLQAAIENALKESN